MSADLLLPIVFLTRNKNLEWSESVSSGEASDGDITKAS
jgi:hypothetical protein